MRADKPRRAAEPDRTRRSSEVLRSLATRGAVVATVSGIALSLATAFTVPSATATALALQSPLGISSLAGGLTASPSSTSPEQLAAEREQALDQEAGAISSAAADAAASNRESTLNQDATSLATENERLRNLSKFTWPTQGALESPFGLRMHPILRTMRMHSGNDIGGRCGQPIWAAQSGTVTKAASGYNGGSGNNVWIDDGDINGVNVSSGYLHMRNFVVKTGQYVNKGDVIGYVGTTGLSTGCHLHFSVKKNGRQSDPIEYTGWNPQANRTDATANNG